MPAFVLKHYKVLLALAVVLFFVLKKGKAATVVTTVNDADKDNIPDGWTPNAFTEQLFAVMQDWFAWRGSEKEELWREMLQFSDGQLKMVYNYYNLKFSGKVNTTLTGVIDSEVGYALASIKTNLVKRLRSLNLN